VTRTAIIVAMDREILPLVGSWTRAEISYNGQSFPAYTHDDLTVVVSGIGSSRAELGARAAMEKYRPETLISAGLAGALIRSLKVGNVVLPSLIVDAGTAGEYRCDTVDDLMTGGVLVTAGEIADARSKATLVEKFHGLLVDMEAAGVARVAREHGVKLRCVKAVSDEFDFPMLPVGRFIDHEGNMQAGRFILWTALRPQYWGPTVRLARNSRWAIQALAQWLRKNLASRRTPGRVVTLDKADHIKT
jgi:adenosylhomocysteine nucleosidase